MPLPRGKRKQDGRSSMAMDVASALHSSACTARGHPADVKDRGKGALRTDVARALLTSACRAFGQVKLGGTESGGRGRQLRSGSAGEGRGARLVAGRHDDHVGQAAHVRDIGEAAVRRAVRAHHARAVHREAHCRARARVRRPTCPAPPMQAPPHCQNVEVKTAPPLTRQSCAQRSSMRGARRTRGAQQTRHTCFHRQAHSPPWGPPGRLCSATSCTIWS
jgi:hypothetical protein